MAGAGGPDERPTPFHAMRKHLFGLLLTAAPLFLVGCRSTSAERLRRVVEEAVAPMLQEHRIPGLVVAVVCDGETVFWCHGVASLAGGEPVTPDTLFELGSVSKVFTGVLGAYANVQGRFRWDDVVARHCPELAGSAFDQITMAQLATYTAGGLPLQFPDEVVDEVGMLAWFRAWRPEFAPGVRRRYSNPSIGLFGHVAARSAGEDFASLLGGRILPALGLHDTYLTVPAAALPRHAFGHDESDRPVRVRPGVLDAEAYGLKSSAAEMSRFLRAQMEEPGDPILARALAMARQGRCSVGPMTQALGWQVYPYPIGLDELLAGNSPPIAMAANVVAPPRAFAGPVLLDKTGSTAGFGAYVAVVPARRVGVVLLANRNQPIAARVRAAHAILQAIAP